MTLRNCFLAVTATLGRKRSCIRARRKALIQSSAEICNFLVFIKFCYIHEYLTVKILLLLHKHFSSLQIVIFCLCLYFNLIFLQSNYCLSLQRIQFSSGTNLSSICGKYLLALLMAGPFALKIHELII